MRNTRSEHRLWMRVLMLRMLDFVACFLAAPLPDGLLAAERGQANTVNTMLPGGLFQSDILRSVFIENRGPISIGRKMCQAGHGCPAVPANPSEFVFYYLTCQDYTLAFTDTGLVFIAKSRGQQEPVSVDFLGARPTRPEGIKPQAARVSYYTGKDSSRWVRGLSTYGALIYPEIYDGRVWPLSKFSSAFHSGFM